MIIYLLCIGLGIVIGSITSLKIAKTILTRGEILIMTNSSMGIELFNESQYEKLGKYPYMLFKVKKK